MLSREYMLFMKPNATAKTRAALGTSVLSGLFGSECFASQCAEIELRQ
jgi:hypothetical protein